MIKGNITKKNPNQAFRCWYQRKHHNAYYLNLQIHFGLQNYIIE